MPDSVDVALQNTYIRVYTNSSEIHLMHTTWKFIEHINNSQKILIYTLSFICIHLMNWPTSMKTNNVILYCYVNDIVWNFFPFWLQFKMSWSSAVDRKLIHDFEVGLSSTSNGIAPDIFPFRSSKHHSHFRLNHPDVPDGREFYVVIKSIGKSGINGLQVIYIVFILINGFKLVTRGKHLHYHIISLH